MSCIWNPNGLEKHCDFCANIYCDARENASDTSSTTNQTEMETYEQKYKDCKYENEALLIEMKDKNYKL